MKDLDLYSAVFDITTQNMEEAGEEFHLPKEAFLFMAEDSPWKADIFQISKERENEVFLEKAYLACLKRFCDEGAFLNWQKKFSLPKQEFQRQLMISLINSEEYSRNYVKVYNHIYSQKNIFGGSLNRVQQASGGLNVPERLLRVYRKQPKFLRKLERRILGMDK